MHCPREQSWLSSKMVRGWSVSHCGTCAGLWLSPSFVANAVGHVAAPGLVGSSATNTSLRCPKDGAAMVAVHHQGVEVDVCSSCGGVWLDQGEIEQILQKRRPSTQLSSRSKSDSPWLDAIDVIDVGTSILPDGSSTEGVGDGLGSVVEFVFEALSGL